MGALSFRSFSRVEKTIAIREQKIVDAFAAPAIDRAKAKLEYLFTQDDRVATKRPPSSDDLFNALTSRTADGAALDPYTLPDETAIDITGDGTVDPAWSFNFEGNTIIYSLLVAHQRTVGGTTVSLSDDDAQAKADLLVTRNAPINTAEPNANCPVSRIAGDGWQEAAGNLQKNFQIDVLTIKGAGTPNRTVSAAEYQQVRSSPKGNKYGAYFRYDLDISPGDPFRWNGAMHSESNIVAGRNLEAYLVSSPKSCIFSPENSEITISETEDVNGDNLPDGYKGNLAAGLVRDNEFKAEKVAFHTDVNLGGNDVFDAGDLTVVALDTDNDSVDKANDLDLDDVYADPVQIFTEDTSESLDDTTWNYDKPDINSQFVGGRVQNVSDTTRPFLDDGYRADNRYGPKPVYNATRDLAGNLIGTPIPDADTELVGFDKAAGEYGLDGYWERRSIAEGLRVIVGQRLELGNSLGWGGAAADPADPAADLADPLYPPDTIVGLLNSDSETVKGASEARQQRSLRDNLAAVQGMVVYHYSIDNGEVPYMCMASTVHPGTEQSLINSRTFGTYPSTGATRIDFLTGNGTNGWEFDFQGKYADANTFASAVLPTQPLGKALRNLAHFSGDPQGGAPSFTPVQGVEGTVLGANLTPADEFVHPYPYLAMWGDTSVLRRILFSHNYSTAAETDLVGSTTAYSSLSPADKSTLQTAACTLGMLASNLESLKADYDSILLNDTALVTTIASTLTAGGVADGDQAQKWLADLESAGITGDDLDKARTIALYRQVERDRAFGFQPGRSATCLAAANFPQPLVDAFCSTTQTSFYPSLYYVFPLADHNQDGTGTQLDEYVTEGGITNKYIFDSGTNVRINDAVNYQVLDTTTPSNLDAVALTPLAIGSFNQPTTATGSLATRDDLQTSTIDAGGTIYKLAFLDKGMMDGRQQINVRVLDLDIGALTLDKPAAFGTDSDGDAVAWIPEEEGLFYAAREDAVREDTIARPRRSAGTWAACRVFNNLVAGNCPMDIVPTQANQLGTYDPPINDTNSISPKPVDMYPDPDRRPYGFRLVNGYNLNRTNDDQAAGISFITDNPAYIYGDFNLHQNKGTAVDPLVAAPNVIEEFVGAGQLLGTTFAAFDDANENAARALFYGRKDLDPNFASGAGDTWRAAEIFADSITILSNNFRDGWIEDAFIYPVGTGVGVPSVNSSYVNYNRSDEDTALADAAAIRNQQERWLREDNDRTAQCDTAAGGNCELPIRFDRKGIPQKWRNNTLGSCAANDFHNYPECFPDDFIDVLASVDDIKEERQKNQVTPPDNVRVNALLVAGIVPMRQNQTYGGIQNFPRLLEYWFEKNLIISGGFFQLNFSTQATAPQDQDAWEPGATPVANVNQNPFYNPAKRIWGYDVAFQYTSVAPIAQRFVSIGRPRSEFYRELPLDDAYIQNLCSATDGAGTPVISCS